MRSESAGIGARSLRRGVWTVVLLLAVTGVYAYCRRSAGQQDKELKLETAAVDRGSLVSKITATGTLSALVTVQVGSQVSGRLQEIRADFNSVVHKGEIIARIDPQLFRAALEQAKANYSAAQANVARAKAQALDAERQARRATELAAQNLSPRADADTAQANADAARAQVDQSVAAAEQTLAALHQAQVNLAYTVIRSPIDGVVISRSVDVGQTVAASLQAPTLFVIAEDLAKMQVDCSVSEADVGKLRPGMAASFTVDAYPGERFKGSVRQIRNAPQTLQNVVTYDAVIDVDNPDLKLKPGMTAAVTFVSASRSNVLRVPNAALRFRPSPELTKRWLRGTEPRKVRSPASSMGEHRVWVLRKGLPEPLTIRTGISDGRMTEVVEGPLVEGDRVVTDAPEAQGAAGGHGPFRMF